MRRGEWDNEAKQYKMARTDGAADFDLDGGQPPRLSSQVRRQLATFPSEEREHRRKQSNQDIKSRRAATQTHPRRRQGQVPFHKPKTERQMEHEATTTHDTVIEVESHEQEETGHA